ncbi:hypothetical protein BC940DRAFT_344025 [Gongronella butleri]|nr:hypothetical protein BC940DRAFT_344025 [Gongronella butleri]
MSASSSSSYHLPAIAVMAGIALAASGYALSATSTTEKRKRRRRIKSKLLKERDDRYVLGLENTGNFCFVNSILQALATLSSLRSYLAERVDEQGDEAGASQVPQNEFILQSVAFALYSTVELLNRPLSRPRSITPSDFVLALERKTQGTISRDQQDAHELFQIISSTLTSEEEAQYKEMPTSLLDAGALRLLASESDSLSASDLLETSSMSSMGSVSSMWSSFSISTVGCHLQRRPRRPRNPFTGLAASKISCLKCGYTAPIRHHTFDNISLSVPQTIACTLETCLNNYTKMDVLSDFQCRKCTLIHTLDKLTKQLDAMDSDASSSADLLSQIDRIKTSLKYNVEAKLDDIPLTAPPVFAETTKQTMFANPPKALCIHLSRSVFHPSGYVQKNHCRVKFAETLDLAPFSTNGFLNSQESGAMSPPDAMHSTSSSSSMAAKQPRTSQSSLVYLRNLAAAKSPGAPAWGHTSLDYDHHHHHHGAQQGLNILLDTHRNARFKDANHHHGNHSNQPSSSSSSSSNSHGSPLATPADDPRHQIHSSPLPSLTIPAMRPIPYRLTAVIEHHGNHDSGHFVTYRRKKLPTGQDVRLPPHLIDTSPSPSSTKFWRCSDTIVEEVDLDTVLSSEAYMLFYERDI